jgi:hypothetical protein
MKHRLPVSAEIAILAVATMNLAQVPSRGITTERPIPGYAVKPWTEGTREDAVFDARSGATIPLSTYSFNPTKVK